MQEENVSRDADLDIIRQEKESALKYAEHKRVDQNDNYTLYRNKVIVNRYTQRQTINIPLMKYAINTFLKNLSETPSLFFPSYDNNEQKEIYYNEYWKEIANRNNIKLKDIMDKKACVLSGRSYKKINIDDGIVTFEIVDTQDMQVHRFVDPSEFHKSRCVIQTGIYRPLADLLEDKEYDQESLARLRMFFETDEGKLEADDNSESVVLRQQRLLDMGVADALNPVLGETYVELNEVYRYEYSKELKEEVIFRYVVACTEKGGMYKLHKKELCHVMGKPTVDNFWYNHFPFETWACDPERTDYHSDSIADIIRPINKTINSYISQSVENRTLRGFNMNYYNSTDPSFVPQTYTPQPWGWYPLPGKPSEVLQSVEIPELSGVLDEIQFLMGIAEKATASTATQTGSTTSNVTLGDIQLALQNAQERVEMVDEYANESWKRFGVLYTKILESAGDMLDDTTIYRKGRQSRKLYAKKISQKDWYTKSGYGVEIKIKKDKQIEDQNTLQKLGVAKASMPDNGPLNTIYNRKLLEFADLTPDEVNEVEQFEKQKMVQQPLLGMGTMVQPNQRGAMSTPQIPAQAGVMNA